RADVAGAFRVMRLRRQQVQREALLALDVPAVEVVDRQPETAGVAADLVQRGEPQVPVERRVLDSLRDDGPGRLLEPRDERVVARLGEREDARERLGDGGACDLGAILVR